MISIAIATYNRGVILVRTLEHLLALPVRADEIVIADQTRTYPTDVQKQLDQWAAEKAIRHLRLPEPSIPGSMNIALAAARGSIVLFVDDDIIPSPAFVEGHRRAHDHDEVWAVVGQVLQPGEEPRDVGAGPFRFYHTAGRMVDDVIACNLSVKRVRAMEIGGFDENFSGAAYRFESDFARRILGAGGKVWFEPRASIHHLQFKTGGVRSYGDHRTSSSPMHSFGDYYFALHHEQAFGRYALRRLRQNVLTRYLLRHPWNIPRKLLGELRGLMMARRLARRGRRLMVQK